MGKLKFTKDVIKTGISQLNEICKTEYNMELLELLHHSDKELSSMRLSRLAGILLKKDFAVATEISDEDTMTKAKNAYEWDKETFDDPERQASPEYQLLNQLREAAPDILGDQATWVTLRAYADHERGLFKIMSLYVWDKIKKRKGKSPKKYYDKTESPEFKMTLDITSTLFNCAMAPVYTSILPVPGIAVAFSLIGLEYGYDKLFRSQNIGDYAAEH